MQRKQELLSWAERHVLACRSIALRYFRSSALRVHRKPDQSPVTVADRLIEERLRKAIARDFPGEGILGEEFGRSGRLDRTYWTIDPIDGTRAFSRGLPSWGILIGRVEDGKAVLGVCDFPAIDTTLSAARNIRTYEKIRGERRILSRARKVRSLRDAVIFHGGLRWWKSPRLLRGLVRLANASYLDRAYGDCYGYLWALRGRVDAVIDYGVYAWDLVPFQAMAHTTGHVMTDFSGHESFTGPETIMAHPSLARLISRTLSRR